VGFDTAAGRGRALTLVRRIEAASSASVASVERVTPNDLRLVLRRTGETDEVVIHVRPRGSVAELAWCAAVARGDAVQRWADLRWDDRMVVGSGG
jgi:hypothetical protein